MNKSGIHYFIGEYQFYFPRLRLVEITSGIHLKIMNNIHLFNSSEFQQLYLDYRTQNPDVSQEVIPLFLYRLSRNYKNAQKGEIRPLTADTISNIVAHWFNLAAVQTDVLQRAVHPKHIRNTQSTRMKIAQVLDVIRKLTCAWTIEDVSDAYYFGEIGRTKQLTDFLFRISDDPGISFGNSPTEAIKSWMTPESCTNALSSVTQIQWFGFQRSLLPKFLIYAGIYKVLSE